MPRRSDRRNLNATVSAEQFAATWRAARRRAMGLAEYLRWLVKRDIEVQGGTWPEDLPERGKYRRE